MAPHCSTLAWKIPWTEEPGRLQSMGSLRVGHDWVTSLSLFTFMHWRRKWQPTPVFLPGESQGRGAWCAAIYGVTQSRTRLKQLSSIVKDQPIDQTPKSSTPQVRASISAIQMCPMDRWWSGYFYQSTVIWIQKLVMNMTRHITIWYWHATQAHNQCIIQTY